MKGKSRIKRTSSFFVPIFVFLTKGGGRAKPELKHALFNYSMQPIFTGCKDKLIHIPLIGFLAQAIKKIAIFVDTKMGFGSA